jgi:hypothetical protein
MPKEVVVMGISRVAANKQYRALRYTSFSETGMYLHSNLRNFESNANDINFTAAVKKILNQVIKLQKDRENFILKTLKIKSFQDLYGDLKAGEKDNLLEVMIGSAENLRNIKAEYKYSPKMLASTDANHQIIAQKIVDETAIEMDKLLQAVTKGKETFASFIENGQLSKEDLDKMPEAERMVKKMLNKKIFKGTSTAGKALGIKPGTPENNKKILAAAAPRAFQYLIGEMSEKALIPKIINGAEKAFGTLGQTKVTVVQTGTKKGTYGTFKADLTTFFQTEEINMNLGASVKEYKTLNGTTGIHIHNTTIPNIIASMNPDNSELASKSGKAGQQRMARKAGFNYQYMSKELVNKLVYLLVNTAYMESKGAKLTSSANGEFGSVAPKANVINKINQALSAQAALWFGQMISEDVATGVGDGHVDVMIINKDVTPLSKVYQGLLREVENNNGSLVNLSKVKSGTGKSAQALYRDKLNYIQKRKSTNYITYSELLKRVPSVRQTAQAVYKGFGRTSITYSYTRRK